MLRADNIICGTTTTGTGTLTLAATPVPPGGIDFDVWARATGIGFGNSAAVLVSYTIIEYTSSSFATAKQTEKGIGTLTLGGSSGIANATLARTTVQSKATSMDSQPATPTYASPTAISIATAANTLVLIGASSSDLMSFDPYIQSAAGDNLGACAMICSPYQSASDALLTTQNHIYVPFMWGVPMLVKRCTVIVGAIYTGGTSQVYLRIYAKTTAGQPGKLLYDFGGTGLTSLAATAAIQASQGNGFFMTPGEYFLDVLPIFAGGSGSPALNCYDTYSGYLTSGFGGTSGGAILAGFGASSDSATTAPDPAFLTGWTDITRRTAQICFALKGS